MLKSLIPFKYRMEECPLNKLRGMTLRKTPIPASVKGTRPQALIAMDVKLIIVKINRNINPHPNPVLVSRFSYTLWINSQKIPHDCRVDNRFEPFR
ncbi:MAG: hypothetical protein AAB275_08435, partial [Deltaproteobacteria bacterium]